MIGRNAVANVAGRAWGVASVYVFVPLYIRFLGVEAYGVIGCYSILLSIVTFADLGLTGTVNREVARLAAGRNPAREIRTLLRTCELSYAVLASIVPLALWLLAPLIAGRWLRADGLPPAEISTTIRLMGLAVAGQLASGLYIAGLMGFERQVQANTMQIAAGLVRGAGGVLVLWLVSPTIVAFAAWHALVNVVYCGFARRALWRAAPAPPGRFHPQFEWRMLGETWRYAAGMAGMAVVSTLLTQADKLVVSKMLPLEMFGYYTLAATVAAAPLLVANSVASAVFPRLTGLAATGDRAGLAALYHRACAAAAVAVIPAGLTLAAFGGDFIGAWTGSAIAAERTRLVTACLAVGQTMQSVAVVPYFLALAHGHLRLNLRMGVACVLVITPLLVVLIRKYGTLGGGISWLVLNAGCIPVYMYLLHRRFLPGAFSTWVVADVGRPLAAAVPAILLCRYLWPAPSSRLLALGVIGLAWCAASVSAAWSRAECTNLWKARLKPLLSSAS